MTLARNIIQSALTRLRLFGGIDVQTYAQPVLFEMLQHKFDVVFDKQNWPHYTGYHEVLMDSATGLPIEDVSPILKSYFHIKKIWFRGASYSLSPLRENVNPFATNNPCIVSHSDSTKVFRLLNSSQWDEVLMYCKTHPGDIDEETDIHLDKQLMVLGICYDYIMDTDTSSQNAKKFLDMYNDRYNTVMSEFTSGERSLFSTDLGIPTTWR